MPIIRESVLSVIVGWLLLGAARIQGLLNPFMFSSTAEDAAFRRLRARAPRFGMTRDGGEAVRTRAGI